MLRQVAGLIAVGLLVFGAPARADYEAGKKALDAGRPTEALSQWRAAAAVGERRAMLALGRLHVEGVGTPQDYVLAHMWFNLAASRGEAEAAKERDALAARMTPQQIASAQERARSWHLDGTEGASVRANVPSPATGTPPPRKAAENRDGAGPSQGAVRSDAATGRGTDESIMLVDELMQSPTDPVVHATVLKWLREIIDPNSDQDGAGNTVMHHVATNTLEILSTAIRRGGNCNARNANGATPLHYAAAQQALAPGARSIRLLADCGADPDLRDSRGATPLHAVFASVEHSILPMHQIINGAGLYVGGHRFDVLEALLEAGADPNIGDEIGDTPLMMAVKSTSASGGSRLDRMRLMLARGADPDRRNKKGVTPVIQAITSHSEAEDIVRLLLRNGADPDLRDRAGDTPLIHAAKHEDDSSDEIKALLGGGADPCLADRKGKLPYDYTESGSSERDILYAAGGYRDGNAGLCARDRAVAAEREKKLKLARDARRRIQSCLKRNGFDAGPPDGAFGPRTRAAILGWQKARSGGKQGEATGYLTKGGADALLAACKVALSPLCEGQTGAGCWMEIDNQPECYTWNPNPQIEETVTWSGECVDGKASGKGKRVWRAKVDGAWRTSSEEGRFSEGKTGDGHWIFRQTDGEAWEGPIAGGEDHGLWVRRGSGGRDYVCLRNGERADEEACVSPAARPVRTIRAADLRSGPGSEYERIGGLRGDERVEVTGEAGRWARVRTEAGTLGFLLAASLEERKGPEPGSVFRDCPQCPEMVVVPAGSFTMGSPPSEDYRYDNELPQHRVTISEPFAVGKYEVTFAEWDACASGGGCGGRRPDDQGWGRGSRPVIYVSWRDAKSYTRWLSEKTGKGYRLLSESEWEYAARAGTTGPFHTGGTISTDQANYDGNYVYGGGRKGVFRGKTVPVGSFGGNGFGLHDMHGNVWEWVEDCWNRSYAGAPSDGSAWESGNCKSRVLRGGSWYSEPWLLRSANRSRGKSGDRGSNAGFRVARPLHRRNRRSHGIPRDRRARLRASRDGHDERSPGVPLAPAGEGRRDAFPKTARRRPVEEAWTSEAPVAGSRGEARGAPRRADLDDRRGAARPWLRKALRS